MAARPPIAHDAPLRLALSVVAASTAPLLLLDGELTVIAASESFCRAFGIASSEAAGCNVLQLGAGEWNVPQLQSLLKATASGHARIPAYEMELKIGDSPRQLVLNAEKLDYGDPEHVRLLLTVADVTDARLSERLKDDLLREKGILLQEVQHRVANSLQIIASVLLQSARQAPVEEVRHQLSDAHNRVMSVAAIQKQLAASSLSDVALRAYVTQLCASIGASMIRDHDQLSIEVTTDDSVVAADVSVSLGLIVTELVINALKHAFPGARKGRISVDYKAHGPNWTLSVNDNGVGMPEDSVDAPAGLGTSIVEALARQLHARVQLSKLNPGTGVSVVHAQIAVVGADEAPPRRAV
jgi:two-component sensor histidine kinase